MPVDLSLDYLATHRPRRYRPMTLEQAREWAESAADESGICYAVYTHHGRHLVTSELAWRRHGLANEPGVALVEWVAPA